MMSEKVASGFLYYAQCKIGMAALLSISIARPLPLCFNAKVGAKLFECDFYVPPKDKPPKDLHLCCLQIGAEKCSCAQFSYWAPNNYPFDGNGIVEVGQVEWRKGLRPLRAVGCGPHEPQAGWIKLSCFYCLSYKVLTNLY